MGCMNKAITVKQVNCPKWGSDLYKSARQLCQDPVNPVGWETVHRRWRKLMRNISSWESILSVIFLKWILHQWVLRTCRLPTQTMAIVFTGKSTKPEVLLLNQTQGLCSGAREFWSACATHASSLSRFCLTMLSWHAMADTTGKVFFVCLSPLPVPKQLKQAVSLPREKWFE